MPYTGTCLESIRETNIQHIVARSEAQDSGLCAADAATRSEFASDLLNLTLASPSVNRHQKSDNDIAEWLPDLNQCWYVDRTLQVRREYGLTIDRTEADAADRTLAGCQSTEMVVLAPGTPGAATPTPTAAATPTQSPDVDALPLWDDNGNGRITCAEARGHGIAPVHRGHPAYQYMRDADGGCQWRREVGPLGRRNRVPPARRISMGYGQVSRAATEWLAITKSTDPPQPDGPTMADQHQPETTGPATGAGGPHPASPTSHW